MSLAGIRSNRGDSYQTLIAMRWAMTILSDAEYQWLEIDSTRWLVDDVVVGKADGSIICCQCKKNQSDFRPWTIGDLSSEFGKASLLLAKEANAEVRFYSRGTFGLAAKLREHCVTQPDQESYRDSLTAEHTSTDNSLSHTFDAAVSLTTYEFLRRTTFHNTEEFSDLEASLLERMRLLSTNAEIAYSALWHHLDHLGARLASHGSKAASVQHRLTRADLVAVLTRSGSMLAPHMDESETRASLSGVSAVGRNWRRDIGGKRLQNRVVEDLLSAIYSRKRSILLTGMPGSGKTCTLLAVQESLELRAECDSALVPMFIQSREFADLATARDREAQGLCEDWVERVARLADKAHVVIVVDSLDVLSISREHAALTYFLAQIDRLLLIENVTVLTACRDFDRRFDRRLATRVWECELACQPLDLDREVLPLLQSLEIDIAGIDGPTRALIRNHRDLAVFIELAQLEGGFSVVTSQGLAQRYLETLVRADTQLGDAAVQAIESVADEMLRTRSLTIPAQRFNGSESVLRVLLSHNVLHQALDGRVGFGHQTLLDVLVISSAIRRGMTLNGFIQSLSPTPFVRPSIRSFVAQLAIGDRRVLRAQLRAVLMGGSPFHLRRLVAESLADRLPHDDDWPLLRDLRKDRNDIFQVIYLQGKTLEWGQFWFKYLVPLLREERDQEALMMLMHRCSLWANQAPSLVFPFWTELLEADWMDRGQVASKLGYLLSEVAQDHAILVGKLVESLLRLPLQEHSWLGQSIVRCIDAGVFSDEVLWMFVTGRVTEDDILDLHKIGEKLTLQDYEFGGHCENYLAERLKASPKLLSLAVQSIEDWSQLRITKIGEWAASSSGFLRSTSYSAIRETGDGKHVDADDLLISAIEAAVVNHALLDSRWWRENRERLCFNHEGALRYFGILSCKGAPSCNIDLSVRLLREKPLTDSEFGYELGCLIKVAFVYFDSSQQNMVLAAVFAIAECDDQDEHETLRRQSVQARFVACIPCHMRPPNAQLLLEQVEAREDVFIETPPIQSWSGIVSPPFPFSVFLETSNHGVLRILKHYTGYERRFEEGPTGGKIEVASMLREAASRDPDRFLGIMSKNWSDISSVFRDAILSGAANCLAYLHGNLKSESSWGVVVPVDGGTLAEAVINELSNHSEFWQRNRAASDALNACSHIISDIDQVHRLVDLSADFLGMQEGASLSGDGVGHLEVGINMARGHIAEALVILVTNLTESSARLPAELLRLLRNFADEENPAVSAVIIRRLPYLQSLDPALGWDLFDRCMKGQSSGLWRTAEPCLYYAYYKDYERVSKWLDRLRLEGVGKDFETWGRISALIALPDYTRTSKLLIDLTAIDEVSAWHGASVVWTNTQNFNSHRSQCVAGLKYGLSVGAHPGVVVQRMSQLFHQGVMGLSSDLLRCYFESREASSNSANYYIYGLDEWLSATAQRDPAEALAVFELYVDYMRKKSAHIYDQGSNFTQLLTCLFAEAEEWEETDGGVMLQRVVSVQDELLSLGVSGVSDWLMAAERP